MNKNVVIVLVLVVGVLVAVPLLSKLSQQSPQGAATNQPGAAAEAPYWNSGNLAGTAWNVKLSGISAVLTMNPGGTATLKSDSPILKAMAPSGQLQGTWVIEGNKLNITADVPGRGAQKISATISGQQFLDDKGKPMPFEQVK
jgi:hypothetical protein